MSGMPGSLRKQPSLQISPPEGDQPKQKGWISRTLRRGDSVRVRDDSLVSDARTERASLQEGRLANANASRTSIATSNYTNDFEPAEPTSDAQNLSNNAGEGTAAAGTSTTATTGGIGPSLMAPPPKIPARNPTRSLKESSASSNFLSVSPAHGPSNASATLPLTSLYLVSGLPKSPQTWTLADHDSTAGVHHAEGMFISRSLCTWFTRETHIVSLLNLFMSSQVL